MKMAGGFAMTSGTVYVRPVTDVVKYGKVVALIPVGDLAMRQPGPLPEGAMEIEDCLWGSTAKAGELALLNCGIRMRAAMEELMSRALLTEDDE